MTSILVTGSSGFIARHLIPKFQSYGNQIHGLDLEPSTLSEGSQYRHVQGDIRRSEDVALSLGEADTIVHLAAAHKDFGIPVDEYYSVNVSGTQTLLEAASKSGVKTFIFYSSVAVYGEDPTATTETSATEPSNHYGKSKLQAEGFIRDWADESPDRRAIIIRPAVVIGPYNTANMYRLIRAIDRGVYFQIGPGKNKKSIASVLNLVDATYYLWSQYSQSLAIVNFVDQPDLSSERIAEIIAATLQKRIKSAKVPVSLLLALVKPLDLLASVTGKDIPITTARISKFLTPTIFSGSKMKELGFTASESTEQAVESMTKWYLSQENSEK